MKASYDERPAVLCNQNNGSWLYNYNIKEVTIEGKPSFTCEQVVIWGEVSKKKLKKAIIEAEFDNEVEKELINDYLAFQAGILTNVNNRDNYLAFLNRRKEIKQMVNDDLTVKTLF